MGLHRYPDDMSEDDGITDESMSDSKPVPIGMHFNYWGKANPDSKGGPPFHLLPFHCLDVAAVGIEYVRQTPHLQHYLMQSLNLSSKEVFEAWLAFWLMLHDLGKYSESFQSQRQDIFEELRKRRPIARSDTLRHDSTGMLYWKDRLSKLVESEQWFGPDTAEHADGLDHWARALTGHHGQPLQAAYASVLQYFHESDDTMAIASFLAEVRTLQIGEGLTLAQGLQISLENFDSDTDDFDDRSKLISWWVAGVTVLAYWLGSNTDFFPYCNNHMPLAEYWPLALERARNALGKTEVVPPCSQPQLNFNDIFPEIAQPSPLQSWAKEVALGDGPQIHLLEDVTGAGKTEAAVMLAPKSGGISPLAITVAAVYRRHDLTQGQDS
jgi:CRISPR-associated endonuclease/helicase Cas3